MSNSFAYIDIILIAMIAGFIILRLRGILGKRTGHERRFYENPSSKDILKEKDNEKVVNLSSGNLDDAAKEQFIKGAKTAYEMIITSLQKEIRKHLNPWLIKKCTKVFPMK